MIGRFEIIIALIVCYAALEQVLNSGDQFICLLLKSYMVMVYKRKTGECDLMN